MSFSLASNLSAVKNRGPLKFLPKKLQPPVQPQQPRLLPGNCSWGCQRNHSRWKLASCISRKSFCSWYSSGWDVALDISETIGPSCAAAAWSQDEFSTKDNGRRTSPRISCVLSGHGVQTNWRSLTVWTNKLTPELDSELWRLHVASLTGKTCKRTKRNCNYLVTNLLNTKSWWSMR